MKAVIWHRPESDRITVSRTVEVFAATEISCCELAYYHTCANSITVLMQPEIPPTDVGDVVELIDDDPTTLRRKYLLVAVKYGVPFFQKWH